MTKRYGGPPEVLANIEEHAINVLSLIHSRLYFPVYSNDLKSIASYLGFRWSAQEASGRQSIAWRYEWEINKDITLKRTLFSYNEDDCRALATVVDALKAICGTGGPSQHDITTRIATIEDIRAAQHRRFGKVACVLPGLERIIECSYSDYQRDKVLFRTHPAVKRSLQRRKRGARALPLPINRTVECSLPNACPHCGSNRLDKYSGHRKTLVDVKLFRGGIKRCVTKYKIRSGRCRDCRNLVTPSEYHAIPRGRYGFTLRRWAIYCKVALRQPDRSIAELLKELCGIGMSHGAVSRLRGLDAEMYQPTYDALLLNLKSGALIHADESKVTMKGTNQTGFVWVFANPEIAVYVYRPTREADFLSEMLLGFAGVLVSDFYAGYDSVDCVQQKCLIHLARDLNDDLFKNPFDEELKGMAEALCKVAASHCRYG